VLSVDATLILERLPVSVASDVETSGLFEIIKQP
jgi:hypothetical protein